MLQPASASGTKRGLKLRATAKSSRNGAKWIERNTLEVVFARASFSKVPASLGLAQQLGATEVLAKPVSNQALMAAIHELLPGQESPKLEPAAG